MKVSIIIPAYNEERRIGGKLNAYSEYFNKLEKKDGLKYEILIVVNNSKDKTLDIVKSYSKKDHNTLYMNLIKGGKGYAVIEGFKDSLKRKNDLIGFVDADLSTSPESFHDLIKQIKDYDGIIASRYIKGAIVEPKPNINRVLASRIYNVLIRALLLIPYRDTQCGAKLFKRKTVEKFLPKLTISKWAFDVDLIYSTLKCGLKIREVPTVWRDKEYSTINFMEAGPWMALGIIRLRLLNSPFKSLMRIYDKMLNRIWRIR